MEMDGNESWKYDVDFDINNKSNNISNLVPKVSGNDTKLFSNISKNIVTIMYYANIFRISHNQLNLTHEPIKFTENDWELYCQKCQNCIPRPMNKH